MKKYIVAVLVSIIVGAVLVGCALTADVKFVAPDHGGPIQSLAVVYELGQDKFFPSPAIRAIKEVSVRELAFETTLKEIAPLNGINLRGIYRGSSLGETQFGTSHILQIRSTKAFRTFDGMGTIRIDLVSELYEASSAKPRLVWQAASAYIYFSQATLFKPELQLSGDSSALTNQILVGLDRSKFIQLPGGEMIDVNGKPYTNTLIGK